MFVYSIRSQYCFGEILTILICIQILVIHCYQKCVSSLVTDTGQALQHNMMSDLPANCRILAYKGYPNDYPLVTPLETKMYWLKLF